MILYTVEKGKYISLADSMKRKPDEKRSLYVNITNRCNSDCVFCLRHLKEMSQGSTLWLSAEPSVAEVEAELASVDWRYIKELVFCGFGEPTMRLFDLTKLMAHVRDEWPQVVMRLNTNGLADLEYSRPVAQDFAGILDIISISLNAPDSERYLKLTRNRFGAGSFEAMLSFAESCKRYVPQVVLTVVSQVENAAEIEDCRKLCIERGLLLRVRPYEKN